MYEMVGDIGFEPTRLLVKSQPLYLISLSPMMKVVA